MSGRPPRSPGHGDPDVPLPDEPTAVAPLDVIADEAERSGLKLDGRSLIVGYTIGREWPFASEASLRQHVRMYAHGRRRRSKREAHEGCARRGGVCDCGERPCALEGSS